MRGRQSRDTSASLALLTSLLVILLMAEHATSPVTADFSSAPPKRTKIVLLGDQSVGKTSLITRCVPLGTTCSFTGLMGW
jgi:hypothetical protein